MRYSEWALFKGFFRAMARNEERIPWGEEDESEEDDDDDEFCD